MEAWQVWLRIIGVIVTIFILRGAIGNWRKGRRQKILDKIAYDVLADFNFNKEKEEIKSIGSRYVTKEYRCPRCNGMLVMRDGRYGRFWGCNRYPECKYTRNVE